MTIFEKMEALARVFERKAEGLRLAISALQGEERAAARQALPGRMKKALSVRGIAHDNNGNGHKPTIKKNGKLGKGEFSRIVQGVLREHGKPMPIDVLKEKLLATGLPVKTQGIGAMARYHFIKETSEGYVLGRRTAPAEEANP